MSASGNKLNFDDMIQHFKNKNVTFSSIDENTAKDILREKTYFFKLRSYKANFDRDQYGKFKNLDFGMLMDFSIIDSHLRTFILNVALNIEHTLKTKLLRLITDDPNEDGYQILDDFVAYHNIKFPNPSNPMKVDYLWGHATTNAHTKNLYKKHKKSPSVWVIFEVISYSNLIKFAEFYQTTRGRNVDRKFRDVIQNLKYVKFLRNAAAHSNPLIRNLRSSDIYGASAPVSKFLSNVKAYNPAKEKVFLKNRVIHHFVATLFVFDNLVTSDGVRRNVYRELKELTKRCRKNSSFYTDPLYEDLVWKYLFIRKISMHLSK